MHRHTLEEGHQSVALGQDHAHAGTMPVSHASSSGAVRSDKVFLQASPGVLRLQVVDAL